MNVATNRAFFRPLTGLALAAALLGVPVATAASAGATTVSSVRHSAPLENRYCDSESGYDCLSYGYAPDYQYDHGQDGYDHHRY